MEKYTLYGKVTDKSNQPVPFAVVHQSDSTGKAPNNAKATQTDEKGLWKLDGMTDDDYVTIRMVGYQPMTVAAKSNIPVKAGLSGYNKTLLTKLTEDTGTQLEEVTVVADKPHPHPKDKKPDYAKYFAIGIFSLFVIGTLYYAHKKGVFA